MINNSALENKPMVLASICCLIILIVSIINPFNWIISPSVVWEVTSLMITLVLVLLFFIDISWAGKNSIKAAASSSTTTLLLINLAVIVCLIIAVCFSIAPHLRLSPFLGTICGYHTIVWHSGVVCLGSCIAAYATRYLSNIEVDPEKNMNLIIQKIEKFLKHKYQKF